MTPSRHITYNGAQLTLKQLAKATGLSYPCLAGRYRKGDREPKLWRPRDCVGGNRKGKSPQSLRGEGVTSRAREEEAAKREARLKRERDRAWRIAAMKVSHAAAMSAPLIDASLLTAAERVANWNRVRNSGQRSWRVTGASMGVAS
jgi:hypothetical protein